MANGYTKSDKFSEKFQRGGGGFSIQKFMLQILGTLNRAFWAWNWYKADEFSERFQVGHWPHPQNNPYLWKWQKCSTPPFGMSLGWTLIILGYIRKIDKVWDGYQLKAFPNTEYAQAIHTIWPSTPPCIYSIISTVKKLQHNFPKWWGAVKGSLDFFLKIYPFWYPDPSLCQFESSNSTKNENIFCSTNDTDYNSLFITYHKIVVSCFPKDLHPTASF